MRVSTADRLHHQLRPRRPGGRSPHLHAQARHRLTTSTPAGSSVHLQGPGGEECATGARIRPGTRTRRRSPLSSPRTDHGFYGSKEESARLLPGPQGEPLGRALAGASAWVTGLRSDQSAGRAIVELTAWDLRPRADQVRALYDWTRERVADFCASEGISGERPPRPGLSLDRLRALHPRRRPGRAERSGRWWWEIVTRQGMRTPCRAHGRLVRSKAA